MSFLRKLHTLLQHNKEMRKAKKWYLAQSSGQSLKRHIKSPWSSLMLSSYSPCWSIQGDLFNTNLVAIHSFLIVLIELHKICFVLISNPDFLHYNTVNSPINIIPEHFNFLQKTCPPSGQKYREEIGRKMVE